MKMCARNIVRFVRIIWFRRRTKESLRWWHEKRDPIDNEATAPKEGDIEFISTFVVEAYTASEFERLRSSITRLGWDERKGSGANESTLTENLTKDRRRSNIISWHNAGIIVRPTEDRFLPNYSLYAKLPQNVSHGVIYFYTVGSGLTLVLIQFVYREESRGVINDLLTKPHSTRARLKKYGPQESISFTDVIMQKGQGVLELRQKRHEELYGWLRRNLPGFYATKPDLQMPTVDFITSKGYKREDRKIPKRGEPHTLLIGHNYERWFAPDKSSLELRTNFRPETRLDALFFGSRKKLENVVEPSYGGKNIDGFINYSAHALGNTVITLSLDSLARTLQALLLQTSDEVDKPSGGLVKTLRLFSGLRNSYLGVNTDSKIIAEDLLKILKSKRPLFDTSADFKSEHPKVYKASLLEYYKERLRYIWNNLISVNNAISEKVDKIGNLYSTEISLKTQCILVVLAFFALFMPVLFQMPEMHGEVLLYIAGVLIPPFCLFATWLFVGWSSQVQKYLLTNLLLANLFIVCSVLLIR